MLIMTQFTCTVLFKIEMRHVQMSFFLIQGKWKQLCAVAGFAFL